MAQRKEYLPGSEKVRKPGGAVQESSIQASPEEPTWRLRHGKAGGREKERKEWGRDRRERGTQEERQRD